MTHLKAYMLKFDDWYEGTLVLGYVLTDRPSRARLIGSSVSGEEYINIRAKRCKILDNHKNLFEDNFISLNNNDNIMKLLELGLCEKDDTIEDEENIYFFHA